MLYNEPSKAWKEITYYTGFDGAHDHHDVVIVDRRGQIVADFEIKHTAEGWRRWGQQVGALGAGAVAVCVETSQGMVVEQLLESGVSLYPIAPVSSKAYRERKAPSGTKTDRLDAWSLADALRLDGHAWKALAKEDPLIAELRLLCRDEVALIEERTALVNQLQSALQEYYPAALEAFEDWTLPAAWAFVELFPSPARLAVAGQRKWEKFLHVHKLARPQTYAKRLEIFARGSELAAGEALTRSKSRLALARIRMVHVLQSQIEAYRAEIEKLFAQHPDHQLFGSLPGAGPKIAPRLLGEIGSDRARFDDPSALQALAGTAPVRSIKSICGGTATSRCGPLSICGPISVDAPLPGRPSIIKPCGPRQIPCRRLAILRSALAQDPLENVATPPLLRPQSPRPQSTQTRLLAPHFTERLSPLSAMSITATKKPLEAQRTSTTCRSTPTPWGVAEAVRYNLRSKVSPAIVSQRRPRNALS